MKLLLIFSCAVLLFLNLALTVLSSISWLALSMAGSRIVKNQNSSICKTLPGLTKRQIKFCRRNIDTMESIQYGARESYVECQFQFHKRRWNCTMIDPTTNSVFGSVVLKEGTREAAFVHAISAAGVAYRITKDCSQGLIGRCGCDLSGSRIDQGTDGVYLYRGCSDNIHYGIAVSTDFVDSAEKQKNQSQEQRLMNEHNNRAGRKVLQTSLRQVCKCHGVSGACEMKTCWDAVPSFREIGNLIKDKFDGATEVIVVKGEQKPKIERKNPMFKRHTHADLVYLNSSPDYCEPDLVRGVLGTKGRPCNSSSLAVDGCDLLCCHRGFNRHVRIVNERCNCKFHYCCRVICDTCERMVEYFTCK